MRANFSNSHLPECWLHQLVCPRRYRAMLPSCVRANLFGSLPVCRQGDSGVDLMTAGGD